MFTRRLILGTALGAGTLAFAGAANAQDWKAKYPELVMAVVPADRKVKLGELSRMLGRKHLRLADENRIAELFTDCDRGAVPALGMAWGVETVVDDELESSAMVYIEGGDHERLLRLSHDQFHALMLTARHGQFSADPVH